MYERKLYKDYFDIDPKYYAAVTADLIKTGQVKWNAFYPHETFVKLLEKTHIMLSGKDTRSLWVRCLWYWKISCGIDGEVLTGGKR